MKKIISLVFAGALISSCYMAGETAKNYTETHKPFRYSGTNTTKGLATSAGTSFLADIALSPVLTGLSNWIDKKRTLDLAYYCYAEQIKKNPKECVDWAKNMWFSSFRYVSLERSTKCVNFFLRPFAEGIVKCRGLAFDYASKFKDKPITETIYDFVFYKHYAVCMPLNIEKYDEKELQKKHKECVKEAQETAKEYMEDIKDDLKEYLAKK